MFKNAIELLAVVTGVFSMVTWLWVFMYFLLVGIEPMLGRLLVVALILTVVSIYCMKKEDKK